MREYCLHGSFFGEFPEKCPASVRRLPWELKMHGAAGSGVTEFQAVCAQLQRNAVRGSRGWCCGGAGLAGGIFAVLAVARNGAAEGCHLHADLVTSAGIQMDLQEGRFFSSFHGAVMKPSLFGARRVLRADSGRIGARVFYHIIFQSAFRRMGMTADKCPVIFSESGGSELPAQFLCGRGRFGKYEQPFHRLVESVYYGKIGLTAGLPGRFLFRSQVVFQDAGHVLCPDPARLYRDAGGLVAHDDIAVFVEYDIRESFP